MGWRQSGRPLLEAVAPSKLPARLKNFYGGRGSLQRYARASEAEGFRSGRRASSQEMPILNRGCLKASDSARRTGYSQSHYGYSSRKHDPGVRGPLRLRLAAPSMSLLLLSLREYWRCALSHQEGGVAERSLRFGFRRALLPGLIANFQPHNVVAFPRSSFHSTKSRSRSKPS